MTFETLEATSTGFNISYCAGIIKRCIINNTLTCGSIEIENTVGITIIFNSAKLRAVSIYGNFTNLCSFTLEIFQQKIIVN